VADWRPIPVSSSNRRSVHANLAGTHPCRKDTLHRQLSEGDHSGQTVPLEGDTLGQLFGLIAKGLIWHHWKIYLNEEQHSIHAATWTPYGARLYDEVLFRRNAGDRVNKSIGNGTFSYEGMQATDDPALTVWRFSTYGGLAGCGKSQSRVLAGRT